MAEAVPKNWLVCR